MAGTRDPAAVAQPPPQLTYNQKLDRWEYHCSKAEVQRARDAGLTFDFATRCWYTRRAESAAALAECATPDAIAARGGALAIEIAKAKRSSMTVTVSDIPVPLGKALYPFQRAGVAFLLSHPSALLADEMGLGKTVQAICLINADPSISRVLVLCQLIKTADWMHETYAWLTRPLPVQRFTSSFLPPMPAAGVLIGNYEAAVKWADTLAAVPWDLVIIDESHHIKSPKAQRTKAALRIVRKARRKVFLTGTPLLNRPYELWTTLSALDPDRWRNWKWYFSRYCNDDIRGYARLTELNHILRSTIMIRRLKEQVLPDLPPKTRIFHRVEPTERVRQLMSALMTQANDVETLLSSMYTVRSYESGSFADAAADAKPSGVFMTDMSKLRHELGLEKLPFVIEYAKNLLEETDKLVVFCHHRDVAERIGAALSTPAVIHGGIANDERNRRIAMHRDDPAVKVLVGTLQAAGTGINLQHASHALFAEIDWVPAILTQAEDRLARIGQRSHVTIHHVLFDGTLDDDIITRIVEKQDITRKAIDGGTQ